MESIYATKYHTLKNYRTMDCKTMITHYARLYWELRDYKFGNLTVVEHVSAVDKYIKDKLYGLKMTRCIVTYNDYL